MESYKDNKDEDCEDLEPDGDQSVIEESNKSIEYCIENMGTGDISVLNQILDKAIFALKNHCIESSYLLSSRNFVPFLMESLSADNEAISIKITKVFALIAASIKTLDETNFINEGFVTAFTEFFVDSSSIKILKNVLDFCIYVFTEGKQSLSLFGECDFFRVFIDKFNKFIEYVKTNEIVDDLKPLVSKTEILGAQFIGCLFQTKDFSPNDALFSPLINTLFMLMEFDDDVKKETMNSIGTILENINGRSMEAFKPHLGNMIKFVESNTENIEFTHKMLDILILFFYNEKIEHTEVMELGFIPFLIKLGIEQKEEFAVDIAGLLTNLTEDLYIFENDLKAVFDFISNSSGDEKVDVKEGYAALFYSICVTNNEETFEFVSQNMEYVDILCSIAYTQQINICYNILGGFVELISYAKENGHEFQGIIDAIEGNDIDESFVDELISMAEDDDDENNDMQSCIECFNTFSNLMNGEDDDAYDPNYAIIGGFVSE